MSWYNATKEIGYNKYDFIDTSHPNIKTKGIFGFDERKETHINRSIESLTFRYFMGNVIGNFEVMKTNRRLQDSELSEAMRITSGKYQNHTIGWYECDVFIFDNEHLKQFNYNKVKQLLEDRVENNNFELSNMNEFWKNLLLLKLEEVFSQDIYDKFQKLLYKKGIIPFKPESFKKRHEWYSKIENMTPFELSCNFYNVVW